MKNPIFTGTWGKCHIQGIAVDQKGGYIYYSFTTKLVKATLDGKIIGSLDGLVGHLGCIVFNEDDGRVYGSLEYKNDGIGEVIKYAFIKSEKLYNTLVSCDNFDDILTDVIFDCVDIKRQVVENDFTEKGERMLLNFGHTLGHAIEKYENFSGLAHGEAVGVGMLYITRASEKTGDTEKGTAEKIEKLLNKFSLPTSFSGKVDELINIMLYDKKRRGDKLNLVLVTKVGQSLVKAVPTRELTGFFAEGK